MRVRDKKGLARAQQLTRCRRRRRGVEDAHHLQLPNQLCNSSCLRSREVILNQFLVLTDFGLLAIEASF